MRRKKHGSKADRRHAVINAQISFDVFLGELRPIVAEYLLLEDMVQVHLCQRGLSSFHPPKMLSQVSLLTGCHAGPGLVELFQQELPGIQTIQQAACRDAIELGGLKASLSNMSRGRSPLLMAVQLGWYDIAQTLLRLGSPVDLGDTASGWSPLMHAISRGCFRTCKLLETYGADVNFQARPHGWTPLVVAVAGSHLDIVEWLLDHGADGDFTISNLSMNFSPGQLDVLRSIHRRHKEGVKFLQTI